jgi:hypothetical protein
MSEGPVPRNWREALPFLVWGVLIFACGFEGIASLLHAEWLQAVLGLGGMLGLTAMLIHWTRIKDNFADVRWLMAAIMVALIVAAFSPYIEQRRWPFAWQFVPPPASTEPLFTEAQVNAKIAEATAPLGDHIARIQANLGAALQERDTARAEVARLQQIARLPSPPAPAQPPASPVVVNGSPMGPQTTMSIIAQLTGQPLGIESPNPKGTKWAMIFSPTEEKSAAIITSLLASAELDVEPIRPADRNLFPEAPELVASGDTGITLHGDSALSRRLFEVLRPCLVVHFREKAPDNLQRWYGPSAHDRQVIWIEIGAGSIWTMDKRCLI